MVRAADAIAAVERTLDEAGRTASRAATSRGTTLDVFDGPLDKLASRYAITDGLTEPLWQGAVSLASAANAGTDEPLIPVMRDVVESLQRGCEIVRRELPDPAVIRRSQRRAYEEEVRSAVAALVAEAGVATMRVRTLLATDSDDQLVLLAGPMSLAETRVALFEHLFARLELDVVDDELLMVERMASRWQFLRWAGVKHADSPLAFNTMVREQEYALVARETMAFESSVAAAALHDPDSLLRGAEMDLSSALTRSRVGIFRVVDVTDEGVTFVDPLSSSTFVILEHNPEIEYRSGFMAVGRLLPLDDETWTRSPGMAFLSGAGAEIRGVASAVEASAASLRRELLLEALLASLTTKRRPNLPADLAPAPSRSDAEDLMYLLSVTLESHGFARPVSKRNAPPEMKEMMRGKGRKLLEMAIDRDVAEWMEALGRQAIAVPAKTPQRKRPKRR